MQKELRKFNTILTQQIFFLVDIEVICFFLNILIDIYCFKLSSDHMRIFWRWIWHDYLWSYYTCWKGTYLSWESFQTYLLESKFLHLWYFLNENVVVGSNHFFFFTLDNVKNLTVMRNNDIIILTVKTFIEGKFINFEKANYLNWRLMILLYFKLLSAIWIVSLFREIKDALGLSKISSHQNFRIIREFLVKLRLHTLTSSVRLL